VIETLGTRGMGQNRDQKRPQQAKHGATAWVAARSAGRMERRPAIRTAGRWPLVIQLLIVWGETPERCAASVTVSSLAASASRPRPSSRMTNTWWGLGQTPRTLRMGSRLAAAVTAGDGT